MALWIDKYRPLTLDQLDYNKPQALFLKELIKSQDFPNLLIHGPSGSGKSTRIAAILRELYGPGSSLIKNEVHHIETPSGGKKIEFHSLGSLYHLELTPSHVGKFHDRLVVQDIIKSVAQTQAIRTGAVKFKVIVLNEVDKLSRSAQNALRRTMEKYSSVCRLILSAETLCNIISPLRSRTLPLRVSCPSDDEIIGILDRVCTLEGVTRTLGRRITNMAEGNLRLALLACEAMNGSEDSVDRGEWQKYVHATAEMLIQNQNVKCLTDVRQRLYEILARLIPPSVIIREMMSVFQKYCDDQLICQLAVLAASVECRLNQGSKPIIHLEYFVASVMSRYKTFVSAIVDDDF